MVWCVFDDDNDDDDGDDDDDADADAYDDVMMIWQEKQDSWCVLFSVWFLDCSILPAETTPG